MEDGDSAGGKPCMFQALLKHYRGEEFQSDVYSQERDSSPGLRNSIDAELSRVSELYRAAGRAVNQRKAKKRPGGGAGCGVSTLLPGSGGCPHFALRFSAWSAKPPVPRVTIHALNGRDCLISSLSAVNSNPGPGLPSQDQSHKDVCPCTGL